MFVYKILEDGISCNVLAHRAENDVLDGYVLLPDTVNGNKPVFFDGTDLTNDKPQSIIDVENEAVINEQLIQNKIRTLAIDQLKTEDKLPINYIDPEVLK